MKTTDAKIVYSPCSPSSKDVIWGKTVNGKIEFQTFGNEGWKTVAKEDILKDIFQIKEEILEELTQSDWAENDTESLAHILNRTHYIIQSEETETLLDEESLGGDVEATTIGEGPYSVTGYYIDVTPVVGTKYRVSVVDENGFVFADDKIVEAVTMYAPIYGTPWSGPAEFTEQVVIPIYGDVSLENPVGLAAAITGENGLIIINTPDYDSYSNQPFTVTLKEITQEEEVQQLDEKFLPETKKYQGDWGESDEDSPNFIKNKPAIKAGQGVNSIVEGSGTIASGQTSHAEGSGTTASGDFSHTEGFITIAKNRSQHVFGECNTLDPSAALSNARGTYVEIVGNGTTSSARSNARTLDWSGNETLAGKITANGVNLNDALNLKQDALGFIPENVANKKTTLDDNSDTYYPTQKAVKTAVDAKVEGPNSSVANTLPVFADETGRLLKGDTGVSVVNSEIIAGGVNINSAIAGIPTQISNALTLLDGELAFIFRES